MAPMSDEERLQFAVAQELAAYTQERGPVTEYWDDAESFIAQLRGRGITLTPPPAPEKTYTIRLTEEMRSCGKHALANRYYSATNGWSDESAFALYRMLEDATPDPEPGA